MPGVGGFEDALAFSCFALWSLTSMACCRESLRNFSRLFCISVLAAETLSNSVWSAADSSPPFFFIVRSLELRAWKRKARLQKTGAKKNERKQEAAERQKSMYVKK